MNKKEKFKRTIFQQILKEYHYFFVISDVSSFQSNTCNLPKFYPQTDESVAFLWNISGTNLAKNNENC